MLKIITLPEYNTQGINSMMTGAWEILTRLATAQVTAHPYPATLGNIAAQPSAPTNWFCTNNSGVRNLTGRLNNPFACITQTHEHTDTRTLSDTLKTF